MSERRRRNDHISLVERLRWRDPGDAAVGGVDSAMMARILAYLFGMGAVLMIGTLFLSGDPERDTGALALLAVAMALVAAVMIGAYDRMPAWILKAAPALGSTIACAFVYYGGPSSTAIYGLYLVWVVVAAALFFQPALIFAHGAYCVGAYAFVLAILDTPSEPMTLQIAMVAGTVVAVAIVMAGVSAQQNLVLSRLESAARTDPLTGLLNRRALALAFDQEIARAQRSGEGLAIVMLDLDGFKGYNDRNGHPAGDRALVRLADVLTGVTRSVDPVARMGGEEFAVLASDSDMPGALALAERLRRAVEVEFSGPDPLTVSCGVASYPENGETPAELMSRADLALYEAKARGRNAAVASTALRAVPSLADSA